MGRMELSSIRAELIYKAKFTGSTSVKIAIKSSGLSDLILPPPTNRVNLGK